MLAPVGYPPIDSSEAVAGDGLRMVPVILLSAAACAAFSEGGASRAAAYDLRLRPQHSYFLSHYHCSINLSVVRWR